MPYLWLLVFFLLPFLIVLKISVSEMETATFKDIVTFKDGALAAHAEAVELRAAGRRTTCTSTTYLSSLQLRARSRPLLCLAIGYPFAYFMARARPSVQPALLMLVMLPFWTSFLLRVYAWKGLLTEHGWVADAIAALGLDRAARRARPDPGAGPADEHAVLARARHGLHLPAVHDPAALRATWRRWTCACSRPRPTSAPRLGRRSGR